MIYVTHDEVEAMTMADKIVVLNAGRIEQVGTPMELYHHPRTEFVAGFIGAPSMNFVDINTIASDVQANGLRLGIKIPQSGAVRMGIRPEHIQISPKGKGTLDVVITLRETLGRDAYLYTLTEAGQTFIVRAEGDTALNTGEQIGLVFPKDRLHMLDSSGLSIIVA